jgi:hypothetical protein
VALLLNGLLPTERELPSLLLAKKQNKTKQKNKAHDIGL